MRRKVIAWPASRRIVLPCFFLGVVWTGFAQQVQYNQNPTDRALLHRAWMKWNEADSFQRSGNPIPAILSLQNAIGIAAQVPQPELTNGDFLFVARLHTEYASARYRAVSVQPNAQTWGAYLKAADDAKEVLEARPNPRVSGQTAASALMLRGQIELMSCSFDKAIAAGRFAEQFYPAGKKEYAQFVTFVEKTKKNGTGLCANNRTASSARARQYVKDLFQVFELLKSVQTVLKTFE